MNLLSIWTWRFLTDDGFPFASLWLHRRRARNIIGWRRRLIFLVKLVAQPLPLPMIHAGMKRAHTVTLNPRLRIGKNLPTFANLPLENCQQNCQQIVVKEFVRVLEDYVKILLHFSDSACISVS